MTREEHEEAMRIATRGSVGEYIDACIAAAEAGFTDLCSINDAAWAKRVLAAKYKHEDYTRGFVAQATSDDVKVAQSMGFDVTLEKKA